MKTSALVALVALFCAACSSPKNIIQPPEKPNVVVEEYKIGVSDTLNINVWKSPELSSSVPVRPDGRVSVPLIGDVYAAGKSAEELSSELTRGFEKYVRNPQVTVVVTNPQSGTYLRRVRATGAIERPISLSHQQGMTVLDIILEAGGLTDFAAGNKAKLYRADGDAVKVYPVLLDDILNKGQLKTNYKLMPGDILTVPERLF